MRLFFVLLGIAGAPLLAADPDTVDILLENGLIIDGSGSPGFVGHVAIDDGVIIAVGEFDLAGAGQVIDCAGMVIAPGLIDLHNHSDRQIIDPDTRSNLNFLMQGCTTVVTGNCGAGPTDVGEFYDTIDNHGAGTNIAHLLPHGSLRERVMGNDNRPATAEELSEMRELAEKAMSDGAWGMSTGLIYVPGCYCETEELIELSKVVAGHGGIYVSHMRSESTGLIAAVEELLRIGREAGLPVHASHFKSSGRDAWGLVRQAADLIQQARDNGQVATADQYPYIASSTSLDATVIPTWARAGSRSQLVERLHNDEIGPSLREEIMENIRKKDDGAAVRFARFSERPDWVGKSLAQVAAEEGMSTLDVAIFVAEHDGASIVNFSMNEDDVRHVMQRPWVATASDGRASIPDADKPHPRYYGTFPRKIGYYSVREGVIPLTQAIRSASGLPADILGLKDRGYVKADQAADLVVFDPDELIDAATFDEPHQYSRGVTHLFVNGKPAIQNGHPTGALAGRALRMKGGEAE